MTIKSKRQTCSLTKSEFTRGRATAAKARERVIVSSRRWAAGTLGIVTAIRAALEGGCPKGQISYGNADKAPASAQPVSLSQ